MGLFQLGPPMDLEELQDLEQQHHEARRKVENEKYLFLD